MSERERETLAGKVCVCEREKPAQEREREGAHTRTIAHRRKGLSPFLPSRGASGPILSPARSLTQSHPLPPGGALVSHVDAVARAHTHALVSHTRKE